MEFKRLKGLGAYFFRSLKQEPELGERLCVLTSEEIVRFRVLNSRAQAIRKSLSEALSRISVDRDRLWADLYDKYGLHGKNVHYDEDAGAIVEIISTQEEGGE